MNTTRVLKEFGLTDKEATVYLALLHLGSATVQGIARKAGTYRTYTYEVLKSLKEQGLVSYAIQSGKQYFEVAEPEKLLNILKEKEQKIKAVLPELKTIYKSTIHKPKIELYEGKEGVKTILDDIIRTKKEILAYGSTHIQFEVLRFYFPNFIRRRVKSKIRTRVLTERSKESSILSRKDKQELRSMRFFPKGVSLPTVTNIYGNKVAILSLQKDIVGVIIEDPSIVKTQRMIFEMLWKNAD